MTPDEMPSLSEPFVSIVVPTFRRPDVLRVTLDALLRLEYPADRHEIIVVDDGSGDGTPDVVAALRTGCPRLTYEWQANCGVAATRNRGARLAHGEVLIFVDDDIIVPPDLVRHHLRLLQEYGDCLVNGHWEFEPVLADSLRETPFGRNRIAVEVWVKEGVRKTPLEGTCYEPIAVTACNLGVRRETFWRVGGFDEEFPFAGCEDQELSLRAKAAGCRLVYDYAMRVLHNDGRLTLKQFCERQRRGALTAVLLALKHPSQCGDRAIVLENGPLRRGDSASLAAKKVIKRLLSTPPAHALLDASITVLEKWRPRGGLLPKLYHLAYGLSIFQGVRDGNRRFGGAGRTPPHQNHRCQPPLRS
jgi:GT2 family glycosyltransferase